MRCAGFRIFLRIDQIDQIGRTAGVCFAAECRNTDVIGQAYIGLVLVLIQGRGNALFHPGCIDALNLVKQPDEGSCRGCPVAHPDTRGGSKTNRRYIAGGGNIGLIGLPGVLDRQRRADGVPGAAGGDQFLALPGGDFQGWVRVMLFTVIPAGFITHVPVELLRSFDPRLLAALVGVALGLSFAAVLVFRVGLRRYESGNLVTLRG